jgi:hypothetical protein
MARVQFTESERAAIDAAWRSIHRLCECTDWSDGPKWREAERLERRETGNSILARAMICKAWFEGLNGAEKPARDFYWIRPGYLQAFLLGVGHAIRREGDAYTGPMVTEARERFGDFKGTVTAVFPTVNFDYAGRELACFDLEGGHCGGHVAWMRDRTRPAKPGECAETLAVLRGIYEESLAPGDPVYRLRVVRRRTAVHRAEFEQNVRHILEHLHADPAGGPWSPAAQSAAAAAMAESVL